MSIPIFLALWFLSSLSEAETGFRTNPGIMGPNALPPLPNADPVIENEVLSEFHFAVQFEDIDTLAATPFFRLIIPFSESAALEFEGIPIEVWKISSEQQERWGAQDPKGITGGDLRFAGRFHLVREREYVPAIGIYYLTKSTTGKGLVNRRFIDAPAYLLDVLLGKDFWLDNGPLEKIRVLTKIGFFSWQQDHDTQNDALDYGATVIAHFKSGIRLESEYRGYDGFQENDKPTILGLTAVLEGKTFDWLIQANAGLRDAPSLEIRAGWINHFDLPKFPW